MSDKPQFGHHPEALVDALLEVERLQGLLYDAHAGLKRALDYRAATPEGLAIKRDVRDTLNRTGYEGNLGERGAPVGNLGYMQVDNGDN